MYRSIFVDEAILDVSYVPDIVLHRDAEYRMLEALFDNMVSAPYEMSQKAVIVGGVGSGKTLLTQFYGRRLRERAAQRRVKLSYIHLNCRELRGSLFMILSRAVKRLRPEFPERGYAANELMDIMRQIMGEDNTQVLLSLDEVDVLIEKEGSDALYYLTRFHEAAPDEPRRLSLILISKDQEVFAKLDKSTLSSHQRNVIRMPEYDRSQISDILLYRAERAFRKDAMPLEIVDFISELAVKEHGDARYAIDVLHGSGKVAETSDANQIQPEHVREAAVGVFQTLKKETVRQLSLHEQLVLLGVARFFQAHSVTHGTTGEIEDAYRLACEEYGESPRGHTQYWKYLKNLSGLDFVNIKLQASSQGRTQLISLERVPARSLEKEVKQIVEQRQA
jgi:cell division control protein 6